MLFILSFDKLIPICILTLGSLLLHQFMDYTRSILETKYQFNDKELFASMIRYSGWSIFDSTANIMKKKTRG
jgi:hypothetical protein